MLALPKTLIDHPAFLANNWEGYEHFTDPTVMAFNKLTFPSMNCTIPSRDKIIPDKGKTLLGQPWTLMNGINGNQQKFKNLGGLEMEVRSNATLSTNVKNDIIEIFYRNRILIFTALFGTFQVGETVTGTSSGSTGIISAILGTQLTLTNITANFIVGETITGGTSGATANVVSPPVSLWHQITENINPLPRGSHEYYFDQWFDTNLNPALSKNLPRLLWVNGYENPSTHQGAVYSWTGGVAQIISFVVNTSISIDPSITWRSLGFSEDASGNVNIVVNGVVHNVPTPADLNTNTLNIASTTGMAIGDIVTSKIEVDISPIPFDMTRVNKGYVFYGDWRQRDLYMSNAFNRDAFSSITQAQAFQNDLVLGSSLYTGTGSHVYRVTIDSVKPDINIQTFTGSGPNDARYDTSGYNGAAGTENFYKISMMADTTLVLNAVVAFIPGETVIGAVSLAQATVITNITFGGVTWLGVKLLTTNMFNFNENIAGSTTAGPGTLTQAGFQNWIQGTKNNVVFNLNTGFGGALAITPLTTTPITTTQGMPDGLAITFTNFKFHNTGDVFMLDIRTGGADTYQYQIDGAVPAATFVPITGGLQTLSLGVQIQFVSKTGHHIGDFWDISVTQGITRAWDNFYYDLPVRKPGQGYKFRLPSNFWTMDTQEESLYINGSYGEWGFVSTELSADLQSESVSYTPLKQAGSNKVLYPYLTGHIENDLVYITENKTLDSIGRQKLLEKPQIAYLSDPVKLDFLASNFVGGRLKYFEKRLYISSPENAIMHVFDNAKGYWQPPKSFPEVAILSIFENNLITHSNTRNQTFTMFTSTSGDDGSGYAVEIRTPYTAVGDRWNSKFSNMSFIEGYITGNPKLVYTVYEGVNGCGGISPHDVDPVICLAPDRAPFGEGSFGSHPFGSDLDVATSYFAEVNKAYSPILQYYFISLGLSCVAKSHTYSILALGMNAMYSETGNNSLVSPSNLVL